MAKPNKRKDTSKDQDAFAQEIARLLPDDIGKDGGQNDPLSINYIKPKPGGPRIPIPAKKIKRTR